MPIDPLITKLRALMTRRGPSEEGWQTASELARELAVAKTRCADLIRALFEEGSLESSRMSRPAVDGTDRPVPVYRLKAARPARSARRPPGRVRRVSGRAQSPLRTRTSR